MTLDELAGSLPACEMTNHYVGVEKELNATHLEAFAGSRRDRPQSLSNLSEHQKKHRTIWAA